MQHYTDENIASVYGLKSVHLGYEAKEYQGYSDGESSKVQE